jgi:hypothetical protein
MQVVLEISSGVNGGSWRYVEFVNKVIGRVDREGRWTTHSRVWEARGETGTAIVFRSFCSDSTMSSLLSRCLPVFAPNNKNSGVHPHSLIL